MITIQRVRVRWTATDRGAPQANARRGLDSPVLLPASLPADEVVIHEVLADESAGYARHEKVLAGGLARAHETGLWLRVEGTTVAVHRMPSRAAFPRAHRPARLFTLTAGQVGRYRANFRFAGSAGYPSWYYEDWLLHITNDTPRSAGPVPTQASLRRDPLRDEPGGSLRAEQDVFLRSEPDYEVDDRVHLYGGTTRPSVRSRRR